MQWGGAELTSAVASVEAVPWDCYGQRGVAIEGVAKVATVVQLLPLPRDRGEVGTKASRGR